MRLKNKTWFLIPAALIFLPLMLASWYMLSYGYSWSDAMGSVLHFGGCKTRYAQKFSESSLDRVKPGMKGDEVFKIIGAPMEGHIIDGKPAPVWRYSLPRDGAAYYHERAVIFHVPPGKPPTVKSVLRRLHRPDTPAAS